jgi:hypothetical protein
VFQGPRAPGKRAYPCGLEGPLRTSPCMVCSYFRKEHPIHGYTCHSFVQWDMLLIILLQAPCHRIPVICSFWRQDMSHRIPTYALGNCPFRNLSEAAQETSCSSIVFSRWSGGSSLAANMTYAEKAFLSAMGLSTQIESMTCLLIPFWTRHENHALFFSSF